jgi:hypothetical protein
MRHHRDSKQVDLLNGSIIMSAPIFAAVKSMTLLFPDRHNDSKKRTK